MSNTIGSSSLLHAQAATALAKKGGIDLPMTWYIAHIIMFVRFKDGNQGKYPVWENLILIEASSGEEAWEKAELRAKEDEGDSQGSFTWDGRPATWVFAGIRKLITCGHRGERPTSGTEVSYSEFEVATEEVLQKLVRGETVELTYVELERLD